jgi:hypothetical protein
MEDILNLWTKELEKQTKDFHQQANQVAKWDQQLIENGNKVKTRYFYHVGYKYLQYVFFFFFFTDF